MQLRQWAPEERDLDQAGTKERLEPAKSIIAINSSGIVLRANVPARKLLDSVESIEGLSIGRVLALALSKQRASQSQVVISLEQEQSVKRLLVVLSELHAHETPEPEAAPVESVGANSQAGAAVRDYIAHELRNNLSVILGFSQLLASRKRSEADPEIDEAIVGLQTEAEHGLQVLDGLLRLAEIRTKSHETETIPLHSIVQAVTAEHGRRFPQRRLLVTGDTPAFAIASSDWLKICLRNLLANAEKVTPPNGQIQIAVRVEGARSTIMVLDGGERLSSETYAALWNIYSDGPPPGLRVTGSGIGLSLCKELVQAMGGRVWAGPNATGGSAFAISLPVSARSPDHLAPALPASVR